MASKELNSTDFIQHHLQNLTFGECSDGKWRFADGHINLNKDHEAHAEHKDYTCDVKEMGFNAVHVDTMGMSLLLGGLFCLFFWRVAKNASVDKPSKVQNAVEYLFDFVKGVVNDNFQDKNNKLIGPLSLTIVCWVFLMNLTDLLPVDLVPWIANGFQSSTIYGPIHYFKVLPVADVNAPMGMALGIAILIHYYSIKKKGLGGFLGELTLQPLGKWAMPFNMLIEIPGFYAKQIALGLRLYGNLFAGEMIFILIALFFGALFDSLYGFALGVFGILLSLGWAIFHVLIIALQAYVFMILTVVFLNQAHETH
ncbi:MAG TPA: F0F1 ATP synthase subunit A [Gammaproteobacteria bacterium]|jgi:F-type H+-transporting ATPase subunit a|nr:F0F1 ATP synthase subunit A [Gammaproteobacteria bacterium]